MSYTPIRGLAAEAARANRINTARKKEQRWAGRSTNRASSMNEMSGSDIFHGQFPSKLGAGGTGRGQDDLLNWMLITAYEIVGGFEGTKNVKFGNPSGSVALPIPPGIQATYEQNWNQATVGLGAQAVAQFANTDLGGRG